MPMRVRYYNHAKRGRPEVALTFDDGPNPPRTDQVLEILAAKDVRAAFFENFAVVLQSPLAMSPEVKIIYADVNPADYAHTDTAEIVRGVLESPHLANGSIIDLHDGSETEDDAARLNRPIATIKALPQIIDGLRARGLEPVGLDDMEFDQPCEWDSREEGWE
jgi:peptidoglycan/xylan/chitin deacetylase (PgdA/CDA1 family)